MSNADSMQPKDIIYKKIHTLIKRSLDQNMNDFLNCKNSCTLYLHIANIASQTMTSGTKKLFSNATVALYNIIVITSTFHIELQAL